MTAAATASSAGRRSAGLAFRARILSRSALWPGRGPRSSWRPPLRSIPWGCRTSRGACPVGRSLLQLVGLFLVFELDEVGYVEERVALQAEVDKCRLHAGQNARYAAVVNGTREGVFVFAFVIDFRELIVF